MQTIPSHNESGVAWGAIFAGAACAAGLSFILFILGFGLGLSAISPWPNSGVSASTIGISTIVWIALTQILASGMGGYIAGRLRVKWVAVHTDEVYFRDTAHGLITWAVATLGAVVLLGSSVAAVVGGGAKAGAAMAGGAATAAASMAGGEESDGPDVSAYFVDSLLRASPNENIERPGPEVRRELSTILLRSLAEGQFSQDDRQYISQVIANNTDLSQQEAQARMNTVISRAEEARDEALEAVDEAREATMYTALWMFIALLCGAFFASLMATFGGRQRDDTIEVTATTRQPL